MILGNGKKVRSINLKSNSNKEFILIHGYTGSPDDFGDLPKMLRKKFNAGVKIPLLLGHGTKIEDLDGLNYKDFIEQIEEELRRSLKRGRKVVIGGYSFGASLAIYLASKYPVAGVFNVSIPYKLKFPLNIPKLDLLRYIKKYYRKRIGNIEAELRKDSFSYGEMHGNGLIIVKKLNGLIDRGIRQVSCPCLSIHSKKEPIGHYKCTRLIERRIGSDVKKIVVLNNDNHNLFFSLDRKLVEKEIVDFFKCARVFEDVKKEEVVAIVPAYNEGERIGDVLKVLSNSNILSEIIVIDDCSKDNTAEVVKKFKKVKYFKNSKNMGKSYSMQRGVDESVSPVIFFCDADLRGLTPEMVENIVIPIVEKKSDMFIALRKNSMQRAVKLFSLNSGERALRRETWERLPEHYKHRYRIEFGLNTFTKFHGRGFKYKGFDYYQTLKEKKYGFWVGTGLRWWMNFDVLVAYVYGYIIDRFRDI